ncbi:MAG: T9SS type A sorting domain-containing protein [Bacteroidetes bacterium]|nr:T9SS type A sorting domain-containing protein [Bacteroidota bacterium]
MIEGSHHLAYLKRTAYLRRSHYSVVSSNDHKKLISLLVIISALLFMVFTPLAGKAQGGFINQGCNIYVQKAGLIHVQSNFVNGSGDSTGLINNDGIIEVGGDFENKDGALFLTSDTGSSKDKAVKFVGSGTQAIKGNMHHPGVSSFYNLVIDKSNATSLVEMQDSIVIDGSLVFGTASINTTYEPSNLFTNNNQKGLLKTYTDSTEFLLNIRNGRPDAIIGYPVLQTAGAPTTGYILSSGKRGTPFGGVQRKINTATSYVWPVGTPDKGFNGVRLNFVQVPGTGSVKTKFCSGSTNPSGYIGKMSQRCEGCDGSNPTAVYNGFNKYFPGNPCNAYIPQWLVIESTPKDHGYWSFASTDTGYYYDMEVFPNGMTAMDLSTMWRAIKHESAYGDDPSTPEVDWMPEIASTVSNPTDLLTYTMNAGCNNSGGIPGGLYHDFSHFSLGKGPSGNALPVEMLYFTAEAQGKYLIRLDWATALEVNNRGFEIQRSTDGINFIDIGWVDGHNNSTITNTYTHDDHPYEKTRYYYRLKQIDNNGNFEYSKIAEAKLSEDGESNFRLYPNPTTSNLVLEVDNPKDEISLALFDINGRMVYDNIYTVEENGVMKTININVGGLVPRYIHTERCHQRE